MSKSPKSFRLSEQARGHLADIVKMTGSNETAIVEMALAFFVNKVRDNFIEVQAVVPREVVQPKAVQRKRRRH